MINEMLLNFAHWLEAQSYSQMLVAGYYSYSWLEATHVLTLMLSIGSLFIIDFRMMGWMLTDVPASKLAERLNKPMLIGFTIMFITGALLVYAKPVETVQSLWFRIKMILLLLAFINAWVFNARLKAAAGSWDNDAVAPKAIRIGAIISLCLWCGVVTLGRYIPYDWVDCAITNNTTILWAAGCVDQLQALQ
ncbi:MAG: hypothetical protein COA96_04680 [SAR86 cluster bacterium]|uniref:DUF6644 domain-containing protein n=1 Tax=SAR86 cluster bacterium TaxID=2030880 RepID=A0A2A5B671_9GAMM|nr:MAG: hypothetical protein COA96_04680 [SAR86 cluster bacterium]